MDLESFRKFCLGLKGATEDLPFDETTLVLRVGGKIFAFTNIESIPFGFSLKCDPERAIELREQYSFITPGWHLNKKHWNSIEADNRMPDKFYNELITHSYQLVFDSLKKSEKEKLKTKI
jgi:predicted DNA-binding protein (MmcQ/YjbR family)